MYVQKSNVKLLPKSIELYSSFFPFFPFFSFIFIFITAQNNLSSISGGHHFQRPRPGSFGNSSTTGSASSYGGTSSSSNNNGKSTFPTSSSSGSLVPPPSNTPRNSNRTKTNEADLISFAHPIDNDLSNDSLLLNNDSTAASPSTVNDSHSNFKQMVDEIHRYVMTIFKNHIQTHTHSFIHSFTLYCFFCHIKHVMRLPINGDDGDSDNDRISQQIVY